MCSVLLEKVPKSQHFSRNYGEQRSGTVREKTGRQGVCSFWNIWGCPLTIIVKNGNQNADVTV
ncbi:MAG: hypothetical protein ACLSCV_07050 [Acutalibacteraceae bacterium]